jgi:hypothetical protein
MKCRQGPANQNCYDSPLSGVIHIHHQSTRFDKICHPWSWWPFWHVMSKVFLYVIPFLRVKLWMHFITSLLCSTYQLHTAVRKKCPEQAVNAIIQSESAIAHSALWRMFSGFGGGKFCNPSLLSRPQAVSMIWLSKVKQLLCGKWFAKREAVLTAVCCEVARLSTSGDADGLHQLPYCWQWLLDKLGDYSES